MTNHNSRRIKVSRWTGECATCITARRAHNKIANKKELNVEKRPFGNERKRKSQSLRSNNVAQSCHVLVVYYFSKNAGEMNEEMCGEGRQESDDDK